MSDHFLVEAKVVVAKEWGNSGRIWREVVKVEELKKTGVPEQVEREGSWRVRGGMGVNEKKFCGSCKRCVWNEVCWEVV